MKTKLKKGNGETLNERDKQLLEWRQIAKSAGFAMKDLCTKLYRKCAKAPYPEIENYLGTVHYINSDLVKVKVVRLRPYEKNVLIVQLLYLQ